MGGLDVVDARYQPLYARAVEVLGADHRVTGVELSGSVAAGQADRWSDLDLLVLTTPEGYDDFLGNWPSWLAQITPTVFARTPIAPFVINAVTTEGLTLDLAVYAGSPPAMPAGPVRYTVGLLSSQRFATVDEALEYAVAEQLRGLAGPFISLVQREEHLRHLTGVPHLVGLLTTVFLAESGAPPPGKHWNQTFTEEQLAAVAALPAVGATRDGIVSFGLALAQLLMERARPLYADRGLSWPGDLAAVAAARIHDCLQIDTRDWLH